MDTLGARLRHLRDKLGLKQKEVAGRIGANIHTYSGWERNVSEPNAATIAKLAEFYGVSVEWLINGEEEERARAVLDLDQLLNQAELSFRGMPMSDEDKQRVKDIITGVFWEKWQARQNKQ